MTLRTTLSRLFTASPAPPPSVPVLVVIKNLSSGTWTLRLEAGGNQGRLAIFGPRDLDHPLQMLSDQDGVRSFEFGPARCHPVLAHPDPDSGRIRLRLAVLDHRGLGVVLLGAGGAGQLRWHLLEGDAAACAGILGLNGAYGQEGNLMLMRPAFRDPALT